MVFKQGIIRFEAKCLKVLHGEYCGRSCISFRKRVNLPDSGLLAFFGFALDYIFIEVGHIHLFFCFASIRILLQIAHGHYHNI